MQQRLAGFARRHGVGLLALFVALGGTSYAETAKKFTAANGQITACAKKRSGAVRLVAPGKHCRKTEQRVTWNERGQAGVNGTPGTPGSAGSIQGAPAGGDLAGSYPDPTIAAPIAQVAVADSTTTGSEPCVPPTPPILVFCGASSAHWTNGDTTTMPGVHVGADRLGQVHIRGFAEMSNGASMGNGTPVFVLPPELRPTHFLDLPIVTVQPSGLVEHAAMLQVEPTGFVGVYTSSPSDKQLVIGDVSFRPGD